jgi:hypothetical protein
MFLVSLIAACFFNGRRGLLSVVRISQTPLGVM